MRASAPTRSPAAEDSTRARILAAALEVFSERGFDGARTREIALRAGANLGLIKYYFGSKESLWRAAVERAFAELLAEVGDVGAGGADGEERRDLERILHRFVRFVARNPAFMRLMNDEGKRDGERMRWLADRFVKPMYAALNARIVHAQRIGLLPAVPPVSLHYIMLGAAGLVFSQAPECRRVTGVDPTREDFATAHAEAILTALFGDPSPPAKRRRGAAPLSARGSASARPAS